MHELSIADAIVRIATAHEDGLRIITPSRTAWPP